MSEIRRVCNQGKITLPKGLRDALDISVGDYVSIEVEKLKLCKKGLSDNVE